MNKMRWSLDFKEDEQNKGWGVKFLENKWQGSKW
jgi:hypothetical protein